MRRFVMPFGSIALLLFSVATPRINMKKWVAPLLTAAILATCALPATAATKKIAVAGDIGRDPDFFPKASCGSDATLNCNYAGR